MTLALLVEGIIVLVQFMVIEHSQVFIMLHNVYSNPLIGIRGHQCPDPFLIHQFVDFIMLSYNVGGSARTL